MALLPTGVVQDTEYVAQSPRYVGNSEADVGHLRRTRSFGFQKRKTNLLVKILVIYWLRDWLAAQKSLIKQRDTEISSGQTPKGA